MIEECTDGEDHAHTFEHGLRVHVLVCLCYTKLVCLCYTWDVFFLGDLAREKAICCATTTKWSPLLARTRLSPHSRQYFELPSNLVQPTHLRIKIYPDGGVSRLRAFGN